MIESKNYIIELANRINLPIDAMHEVLNFSSKIFSSPELKNQYEKLKEIFFSCGNGENFGSIVFFPEGFYPENEFYSPARKFAEMLSVKPAVLFMTLYCLFSRETLLQYRNFNIADNAFFDTMSDITLWVNRCYKSEGYYGIHQYSWFANHLRRSVVRLGRFQYQIVKLDSRTIKLCNEKIKRGEIAINLHIPEGGPMNKETRIKSYEAAYNFFAPVFSEKGISMFFICNSWLLYPKHREFLPEDSNILDFLNDFKIISFESNHDTEYLWRIFGKFEKYLPGNLPCDTSLRRSYIERIKNGGEFGSGLGAFLYKNNKIYTN